MCGRYTFQPTEAFYRRFHIANRLDGLVARYNIAPGQMVPVIVSQGANQVVLMRWGLTPRWAKEEKTADNACYRRFRSYCCRYRESAAAGVSNRTYFARTIVLIMGYTSHLWEHWLAAAFKDQACVFPARERWR